MKFTLGTVQLGLNYGISNNSGQVSEKEAFSILDTAYQLGVDYYDTAMAYGNSEYIIGKWAKNRGLNIPIITKFDVIDKNWKREDLRIKVVKSLERLNQDKLACLMLHNFEQFENNGIKLLKVLYSFIEEGLTENIGVSIYSENHYKALMDIEFIDFIQGPFNLFDNKIYPLLDPFKLKYFARSIYLQGLFFLSPSEAALKVPGSGELIEFLQDIAKNNNVSVSEIAIKYVRAKKNIESVVVGVDSEKHLRENYDLFKGKSLSVNLVKKLDNAFDHISDDITKPYLWRNL